MEWSARESRLRQVIHGRSTLFVETLNKSRRQCEYPMKIVVVEMFGNPTSLVFHFSHSVLKLKYDRGERGRASLIKEKTTKWGRGVKLPWESVLKAGGGVATVALED
ncbi:hypothetical protein AVEN_172345-1 [Araneus ventricosus]|uniref:Uncharacterized protein n=1 Tax=Araneus ventricosus TaxID=182803 RepID=A0A4Y2E1J0_ARAVE|nr:hypothetical protein AVEN_172345-1 [Araneus ventricosus]